MNVGVEVLAMDMGEVVKALNGVAVVVVVVVVVVVDVVVVDVVVVVVVVVVVFVVVVVVVVVVEVLRVGKKDGDAVVVAVVVKGKEAEVVETTT